VERFRPDGVLKQGGGGEDTYLNTDLEVGGKSLFTPREVLHTPSLANPILPFTSAIYVSLFCNRDYFLCIFFIQMDN
jgi:hypothetical protein